MNAQIGKIYCREITLNNRKEKQYLFIIRSDWNEFIKFKILGFSTDRIGYAFLEETRNWRLIS